MQIPEEFLHFVWQFKLFNHQQLATIDGLDLQIVHTGLLSNNAGPDFVNAKIKINDTLWAGQVEIHIKSSDWNAHKHQDDPAYNNVVLHVVAHHDIDVYTNEGVKLPCLELNNRIAPYLVENYNNLMLAKTSFPCENQIKAVDSFIVDSFLSRVLIERFEHKSKEVFEILAQLNGHWEDTFYRFIARNFGFKVNAVPMQILASSLPQVLFAKHKDQPLQIEALLFGQAGFLEDNFDEQYPNQLKQEYEFLKNKYNLKPLDRNIWKFMRMRPNNFPTRRIAQLAGLIAKAEHLFSKILDAEKPRSLFEDIRVNKYWETHYHFNKKTAKISTSLGESSIDNLLINTISLFLFAYAKYTDQEVYQIKAFKILEEIRAEKNTIIDKYKEAGLNVKSAFQSQALLELKKYYCDKKQCLNCGIGLKILNK